MSAFNRDGGGTTGVCQEMKLCTDVENGHCVAEIADAEDYWTCFDNNPEANLTYCGNSVESRDGGEDSSCSCCVDKCKNVGCADKGGKCYHEDQPDMKCEQQQGLCQSIPSPIGGNDFQVGGKISKFIQV